MIRSLVVGSHETKKKFNEGHFLKVFKFKGLKVDAACKGRRR